jgi:cobalt/nickel transport system ATP-binding protein
MEPELLVLDEPMAGLDVVAQEEFLAVLDDLHARGITLLLATHDIDFAYAWADRIHLMASGSCVDSMDAENLTGAGDALKKVGLPLPEVVELVCRLRAHGLLAAQTSPRSHRELLSMLETNINEKGNTMTKLPGRGD